MIEPERIRQASLRLLEPYITNPDTPYLSEDQRELSELPFEKRAEWMAEWLAMAQGTVDD